jgi:6-phospho-beta-glucosidase
VVEVPCLVDSNGAHPMAVDPLGAGELDLVRTVKRVERLTIEAALSGSLELVERALAAHPLVGPAAARKLVETARAPQ